jgi:hypothetical protein
MASFFRRFSGQKESFLSFQTADVLRTGGAVDGTSLAPPRRSGSKLAESPRHAHGKRSLGRGTSDLHRETDVAASFALCSCADLVISLIHSTRDVDAASKEVRSSDVLAVVSNKAPC